MPKTLILFYRNIKYRWYYFWLPNKLDALILLDHELGQIIKFEKQASPFLTDIMCKKVLTERKLDAIINKNRLSVVRTGLLSADNMRHNADIQTKENEDA